jgi:hypothetical protein
MVFGMYRKRKDGHRESNHIIKEGNKASNVVHEARYPGLTRDNGLWPSTGLRPPIPQIMVKISLTRAVSDL